VKHVHDQQVKTGHVYQDQLGAAQLSGAMRPSSPEGSNRVEKLRDKKIVSADLAIARAA
jgi:hypothetical protein